jgi:hypothetical protein
MKFHWRAALLIWCSVFWCWAGPAQNFLTVNSANDGQGLFSYTFDLGPDPYVWRLDGQINLQSHGILEIGTPAGWNASVDQNEVISWQPTEPVYLGQPPLTFWVRSSSAEAMTYDQLDGPYQRGILIGVACTLPDHQTLLGGYQAFSFVGPVVVPEPSTPGLLLAAALCWSIFRFFRLAARRFPC